MLEALKKTLVGVVLLWVVLLPVLYWLDIDILWWIAIVGFGVIGPSATFIQYWRAERTRTTYPTLVFDDLYVPTFTYRGLIREGEALPRRNGATGENCSIALLDAKRLIFRHADPSLCKSNKADFWTEVKGEIAILPHAAITDLYVFTPDEEAVQGARKRAAAEDRVVNLITGITVGRTIKTAIPEALLIIEFQQDGEAGQLVFANLSTDARFDFSDLAQRIIGDAELDPHGTLNISNDDRPAVWNAKHGAALLDAAIRRSADVATTVS